MRRAARCALLRAPRRARCADTAAASLHGAAHALCRAQTVRDKCFQKCITRPGSSMSNSEVQCLANCCDRYIDVSALRCRPCTAQPVAGD